MGRMLSAALSPMPQKLEPKDAKEALEIIATKRSCSRGGSSDVSLQRRRRVSCGSGSVRLLLLWRRRT